MYAAIGMGLAVIGAGIGIGNNIRANMILTAALVEGAALIAIVMAFLTV